jgi:hypothetical protein
LPTETVDVHDFGIVGDGITDDTVGMAALLTAIGSSPARLVFTNRLKPLLSAITFPTNLTLDLSSGGSLMPVTGQTITIRGGMIGGNQQIFYNAVASQGTVDFTGSVGATEVYPEWWGASPSAGAATNTLALQAAIHGAFGTKRTNGSGLGKYNKTLVFSGIYDINDELRMYDVIGFHWQCINDLKCGINQTVINKRIIDGQSVAYGDFRGLQWSTSVTQDASHPLVDLDYNGVSSPGDIRPQFVDFYKNTFLGNGVAAVGVQIAKSGGSAQGSNIYCWDCAAQSFTTAAWRIGTPTSYAQNALAIGWYGGDIQGSPRYGIAVYGGGYVFVDGTTFENGFTGQTGFDVYCEESQGPCEMRGVRSESRRLIAGNSIRVWDSAVWGAAAPWAQLPGTLSSEDLIFIGTSVGGDGVYYQATNRAVFGGLGPTIASSGTTTSITCRSCKWRVDQFAMLQVTVMQGAGSGKYCVITSNTEATIVCAAGWISQYDNSKVLLARHPTANSAPDNTSTFVVEPNWSSNPSAIGAVTFRRLNFDVIGGSLASASADCRLVMVHVWGGQIKCDGQGVYMKDVSVSRADWQNVSAGFPLDNTFNTSDYDNVQVLRGQDGPFPWKFRRNGTATAYTGAQQHNVGTMPIVWSAGQPGGGLAANDVWIGGRSDPESGSSRSRAVLEYGGIFGRATPTGVNKDGADTQIQGGLPTGSGTPGAIEFWIGKSGPSGTSVLDGAPVAGIRESGLSWTKFGTAVASSATVIPTGNLFHVTGNVGIRSVSGNGTAPGTEITLIFDGVLTVTNGLNLRLSSDFITTKNSTLTLKWDGGNWYEVSRSAGR